MSAPIRIYESGYVREGGETPNPTAVRWWIFAVDPDGLIFARGGRLPTARRARWAIDRARKELELERVAWKHRRTHELFHGSLVRRFEFALEEDGSLRPLIPSDFELRDF